MFAEFFLFSLFSSFHFHYIVFFFVSIKLSSFASGYCAFIFFKFNSPWVLVFHHLFFSIGSNVLFWISRHLFVSICATCLFCRRQPKQYVMLSYQWNFGCIEYSHVYFIRLVGWTDRCFFFFFFILFGSLSLLLKSTSVCSARQNVNAWWTHSNYNINNKNAIETKSHT